ncbi:MAG: glycosyltransferase [Candidatus Latescibacterota bacterium]|nr:MAG: glycosyltransferase [Candidatus Latescibacterota bacterium]
MTRKACLVGPAYPYRGGIAHFTSVLAKEFEKDHDVLVVNFKRLYPSFLFPGKTQYDESNSPVAVDTERCIDSLNPVSFWRTAKAIARFEPDLVVFQWWQPFFAVAYMAIIFCLNRIDKRYASRIVFLCHNVLPHESSPIDRVLIRIGFKMVNSFLVHSSEDRQNLLTLKGDPKVEVHPLPIFDMFVRERYTRESAREELGVSGRVVLFFGYIRAYKGLGVLLDGFARSLKEIDATLFVVGEFYEGKERYMSMIEDLGLRDRVVVVDRYVPNEEVEKYFVACDVVALPYLSATQSAIVQVAFSFHRPVIVTAVGGLPEVVEDGVTGYVVQKNDPEALAGALLKFFEEGKTVEMEQNIAKTKVRFSWSRCKELLLGLAGERGAGAPRR